MSIVIKGMNKPKNCDYCQFCSEEDIMFEIAYQCSITGLYLNEDHCFPDICPIVELPEHHGRLIDADEMKNLWTGCSVNGSISPLLDARPTVIEAE